MYEKVGKAVVNILVFIALVLLSGILLGFPTKWLWNWLVPDLFGLSIVNFWQSWGLIVLCGLLFRPRPKAS